ncbi:carbon-nitrogen hydrolase family protein [Kineococcus rubinsiae]|uniref:carbon-nitrogen hydrolase family protein n=1 Tax=Kineococcus rubinsiae TaxID=2609562 RepID=UPI00142FED7A|nr:carbon-nitrogen hydrolase family protein [Kineococcus rubinsiae]NIZ91862.1 carbon-nitrogen hydrolase family protein [Kineococcus rubinsiae]
MTVVGDVESRGGRRGSLRIAVAQPVCVALDPVANAHAHADLVRRAAARLVVFPEMSLTGYELQAPALDLADASWRPLVQACGEAGSVALVGAPVADGTGEFIATVAVTGEGVQVAYRKAWPGGEERARFGCGPGATVLQVDGWRIGLGICRDTGVSEHVEATAALGVDLFAAGLADVPEDLAVQRERAGRIARACGAPVAFASFAGPTGRGYERTAGASAVYSGEGTVLAGCGPGTGEVATAVLG